MLPVPFVGPHVYDAIFIASYVCWLLFEMVTGQVAEIGRPETGAGPRLVPFSDLDDLGWDCAGVCCLLWRAASGDSLDAHCRFSFWGLR